ncbi:hypothetical protein E2C01_070048 [Portunus trituberculatus]|uniref:Uncharacterized protein n=1 Tax=Portunus trituberculatus TaxID=210409 RepID=A0A5B7I0J2_PORTR|nr:hypothetical protein [Portunus trituberculatus]
MGDGGGGEVTHPQLARVHNPEQHGLAPPSGSGSHHHSSRRHPATSASYRGVPAAANKTSRPNMS